MVVLATAVEALAVDVWLSTSETAVLSVRRSTGDVEGSGMAEDGVDEMVRIRGAGVEDGSPPDGDDEGAGEVSAAAIVAMGVANGTSAAEGE